MPGRVRPPGLIPAVAALCAVAVAGAPAAGQSGPVEVRHTGPDSLLLEPGGRASAAFQIANAGPAPARVRITVELPPDWRAATPPPDLELAAGEAAVRVVSFFPAADAPAGAYELVLGVQAGGSAVADTVHVLIPAEPRLRAGVESSPRLVVAGEPYVARFMVENAGNVALPVRLVLESRGDFTAGLEPSAIRLGPGESVLVDARVETPENLRDAMTHPLTLRALAPGDSAEAVARVEVVPGGRGTAPDRGGMPAELRLRVSDDPRAGPPVRLQAAGPLAPGSSTRLDLLLQGPAETYSAFGETDIYRIGLASPHFSLDLGDQLFSLSELTEPGRQGLGVEVRGRAGPIELGGFAQTDRRSFRPDTQFAAYTRVRLGAPAEVGANWFRRHGAHGIREVVTAEGSVGVTDQLDLDGEYGRRPANGSQGRSIAARGRAGPLGARLRHLRVDSAYGGPFAGLALDGAHLSVRPWRAFYLEGSLEDQHLRRHSFARAVDRSLRTARAAVGYGSFVALEGSQLETSTRSGEAVRGREARSIRVRLGLPLGPVGLYPSYERGRGGDPGASEPTPFWRAGLRTEFRSGPASLSGSVEYFTGGTLYSPVEEEGLAGTLSASLRVGEGTRFLASAYGTRYVAPAERENLVVNARLEQRLPLDHRIAARLMSRTSRGLFNSRETVLLVDYTIPLTLPIGREPEAPSTVVRVFDALTGMPVRGVVVEVGGRRVVTDEEGSAVVAGLLAGSHYVDLDRATAGASRVPTIPLPHPIEIEPGIRRVVEVGLVAAGALSVRTELARAPSVPDPEGAADPVREPFERVLIEVARDGERFRRATDQRGLLELRDLRPGRWTVSVASADLPPFHRFERDSVAVEIAPGEEAEITLLAVPVQRRLRMVASGEVSEEPTDRARADMDTAAAPPQARSRQPPPQPEAAPEAPPSGGAPAGSPPESDADVPAARGARSAEGAPAAGWSTFRTTERTSSLMEVARRVYLRTSLWPKIWLANREAVADPEAVPAGIILRIPPRGPLTREERQAHWEYLMRPGR